MPETNLWIVRVRNPVFVFVAAAALTACASHPKPMLEPTPRPPAAQPPSPPSPAPPIAPVQSQILPGSAKDFVVNVGDRVYFDTDQFNVRADAAPVLAAQARWLVDYPSVTVRIEGNADERGTREYNFALGARRAESVKTFLIEHGVSANRITTISYGKERPIDPGAGEAAWQHNRNAQTAILSGAR